MNNNLTMTKTPITVAKGDGIGPEIMDATLHILKEAGAQLDITNIKIGEEMYLQGNASGVEPSAWDILRANKVFLKAPITTPQGGGYKSLNVTTRKTFGLYANVRPCVSYFPFVHTKHPNMDVVVVRENEEDLYAGIEHQQTPDVVQCLKLITRPGTERIVRYAFEYAVSNNRKKVTCFTKDNIMKMADGLFRKIFEEIGEEYPQIEKEHWIVDIGAAKLADTPEIFDVLVLPNLYGDILSDVAAQIAGSVGLAGSANIGEHFSMFEAIHGSAPRRAGQNLANPSGLFLGSIMMLLHINQREVAERAHNAWLKTIEDGIHTYDIYNESVSKQKVGTKEFAQAVVARLGQKPETLHPVTYTTTSSAQIEHHKVSVSVPTDKKLIGVDVFVEFHESPEKLAELMKSCQDGKLNLSLVATRGMTVWPTFSPETLCGDHYACRFVMAEGHECTHRRVIDLLSRLDDKKVDFIKTEHLCTFDGKEAFTKAQGE
ncbi:MAG: isocitrate dehydrogenase [Verrucomicrobia bacterium CG_4_10_14_3_um_filter_43_23]|nr:MAG: isocitrate dehydrogenase [Verrucomicrobia bacterium CG22_combo_CG10-13_8_21_14_all_43_17]PIX57923.1 MAG: isocitrate dehydrogenase [Verrucomicrobia bacterium CG_4_10_14_3_um_filter_43_23]PIY61983.1 MAG: isocitrate dehydrogenase [Verrucomicrobia bacterium CG_4_10_14_0_8_um_filter_43_34]PJA43682.1 MAG: isocitrate dehydrogenase [Verrucomicrobia bacterium CG_4_9_14_3_um_filter_43_20]